MRWLVSLLERRSPDRLQTRLTQRPKKGVLVRQTIEFIIKIIETELIEMSPELL